MPKQKLTWKTVRRKVSALKGMPRNPRTLTDDERKQLTRSIEKFNLVEIPAIDTDNTILAGHQRVAVLIDLGRKDETIDVRIPSRKLSAAERREYNIRSNKNTGEWDLDILQEDFKPKQLVDYGFTQSELTELFAGAEPEEKSVTFAAKNHYRIVIECKTKNEQTKIYRTLAKQGIECKLK